MHELSIVMGLCEELERLASENGASRISHVSLDVGAVSNVVPQLLRDAFDAVRGQSPLIAQAALEIRALPVVLRCDDCEERHELDRLRYACPICGGSRVAVEQGDELLLREVELEISDEGDESAGADSEPRPARGRPR